MPSHTAAEQIRRQLERSQSPNFGADAFQRIASSGVTPLSDLIAAQRATGGNRLFAQEQNQANQQRASAGAFDAFNQFQLSNQGNINQLLGLLQGGEQFGQRMDFQRDQFEDFQEARRADRKFNFINSLLGLGGTALGTYLTGGFNMNQQPQQQGVRTASPFGIG